MIYLTAYLGFIVSFLIIDVVWITMVVRKLYEQELGSLMRESPNMGAAAVFYLFYAACVIFIAVKPAIENNSNYTAIIYGVILGAFAYGTFAFTNYSVLNGWSMKMVVSDVLWGMFITSFCSWVAFQSARFFS